jgi:drug/metabolite transporter (DMT)-like permease
MDTNRNRGGLVIGIILIIVGVLALFGRAFTFINWDNLWPLVIVGVGAAFFIGMVLGGKSAGGLAVPGSILVTIGLILLVINFTEQWTAWAYAWALIICGIGVGVVINGYWSDQPELRKRGFDTIRSGVILFLIFGVIMGFIFSVTGVTNWGNLLLWGVLLALVGLYLLISHLLSLGKAEGKPVDLFWPILMIGVGVVASLAYLNVIPAANLWVVLSLWPLLLIVLGVGVLLRGRSPWIGAVLGVLVVAVIFVVAFAGPQLGLKASPFLPFDIGEINIGNPVGPQVSGSGNMVTETRQVSGVDRVRSTINAIVQIQQGATEALTVSADDNLLPYLVTEVRGGELVIRWQSNTNIRTFRPVQVNLTVKDLAGVVTTSSGKIIVGPLTTGDFNMNLSSSGDVEIQQIQAGRITAGLSSSGSVAIKGSANSLNLSLSSSGSFIGSDLQVQQATVTVSSSGDAALWVTQSLQANISSSGNVTYYGNPSVRQNISSSGRLISLGAK